MDERMRVELLEGSVVDRIEGIEANSVDCIVTSPPYWAVREYGGQSGVLGLERTMPEHIEAMQWVFHECWRVLSPRGTLWLNYGDSYFANVGAGFKKQRGAMKNLQRFERPVPAKNLLGLPWRIAFALQDIGWYLRADIIWHKPNPLPESAKDRPTRAHEYVFLLTKTPRYTFNADAVREEAAYGRRQHSQKWEGFEDGHRGGGGSVTGGDPDAGRHIRSVWTFPIEAYPGAHFATFPKRLAGICIEAGSSPGGLVFDPFAGTGTTLQVAANMGRHGLGIEINPEYVALAQERLGADMFYDVEINRCENPT